MAFPSTPLTVLAEVALGADLTAAPGTWSFTDVTSKIYTRDKIAISRGRADEASTADTSTLAMTADNRDGRWSTRNPSGAWYGQLRKGTPVRISAEGHVRYTGFFSELPPRWDVSGLDRYAPLAAKGLLYRLGQGRSPLRSALRRTITKAAPTQYWPLEDGPDATQGASALSGGAPTSPLTDGAVFNGSIATGSDGAVDLSGGGTFTAFTGQPIAAAPNGWEFECVVGWDVIPTVTVSTCQGIAFAASSGAGALMGVGITNLAGVVGWADFICASDGSGAFSSLSGLGAIEAGRAYHLRVVGHQVGTGLRLTLYVDGVSIFDDGFVGTLMMPDRIVVNSPMSSPTATPANVPCFTQLAFWAPFRVSATTYLATNGYLGEQAHTRFLRLSDEEGIPATCGASESQAMGTQTTKSYLDLVRECEGADQGYLYEGLDFGLVLQGHTERENLTAELALNYTTAGHVAPPLEPTDDDQAARNDVEVKRDGGSSSRQTEESAAVELSIPNIGRRDESVTYNLATDDQTYHLAGYRLHLGTFPGYRYPTLTLNLAAGPSLITAVCAADLAFRMTVANPPTDIGPDTVSVIVEGYSETLEPFGWDISANCSLNGPHTVGVLAATSGDTDPLLGWLDWDTCTLHTTVNTTATSWAIDASPVDTTATDDFPRQILIEGELVTVTACSGASAPQTWTVTRSVNGVVKAHTAGATIALAYPYILAL
jgi:hypothetical protein